MIPFVLIQEVLRVRDARISLRRGQFIVGIVGNQITHSADAHFFKGIIEIQDGTRQRTVPQPFALSTQRRSSGGGHGVVHPSRTGENSGDKSNSSPASLIKKIVESLKDRPSWFRDCWSLEVFTMLPARNGGTIELVNMQMCAPTTLVPARDFWTLRYTTTMEDGSLVVCERSFSGSGGGPSTASAQQFVRAEMLPSGYLVRPCKGGSSIVHIVEYLDLEAWSVPEVLRPLYESSRVVAQKITTGALRHIRQIAKETSGEAVYALGRYPAVLRWRKPAREAGYYAANCQWRGCK